MHIVINKNKSKKRKSIYNSVLLRESYREGGRIKKRTIANLSSCSPEEITAMKLALKHKDNLAALGSLKDVSLEQGKSVGAIWAVYGVLKRLGMREALGTDFQGQLAMWQVCARVIGQGSRLSAVRLGSVHAFAEVLDLSRGLDENDLYQNLAWLSDRQQEIETALFKNRGGQKSGLFLYDVTSSYLEGTCNELGAFGYNRDKKRGKEQIVIGLLCDEAGDPVSVSVFEGNTADGQTVPEQIQKVATQLGCEQVTFVGDRAMFKQATIATLPDTFHYITAITKPQVMGLINQGVFQLELFQDTICEVQDKGIRYILRRNPLRASELRITRQEKQASIQSLVDKKNLYLRTHPQAKQETAILEVERKIMRLKVSDWLSVNADKQTGQLELQVDQTSLDKSGQLDGCYVLKTDLPAEVADTQTVHDRYRDLAEVEQAFRYCKTGLLEIRPVYVRREKSTRGHVFIVMLAYLILHQLQQAWKALDLTAEEGLLALSSLSSTQMNLKDQATCLIIPKPNKICRSLLDAIQLSLPESLPHRDLPVVTRKKLPSRRR